VSLLESLYCPLCWTTYILSFVTLISLFWSFKSYVLEQNFIKFMVDVIRDKSSLYLGLFIFILSFFLHMVFMTSFGIKTERRHFEALILDWETEEVFQFSEPPLLKAGAPESHFTLVEFADFLCPSCKRVQSALNSFLKRYPNVTFHFYTFPLDQVCNEELKTQGTGTSCLLSRAAICAEQQNQGWEFHDFLFKEQSQFRSYHASPEKVQDLIKQYVQNKNWNVKQFMVCLESPSTHKRVKEMARLGAKAKIYGTPTFFVNGKLLSGFSNNLLGFLNYIYKHHKSSFQQ